MRKLALILLNTVIVLLAFELLARAILWRADPDQPAAQAGFSYSAAGAGDLAPNLDVVELLMPARPYRLQTNSAGLRNTDEINPDPAVIRVLALGDSFVYGLYVHNLDTFPARLEERLNEKLAASVQVLNAAVPGYTIADQLSYLRDKGLGLEPDLVVLGFYTNDIFDFYPPIREHFAREVVLAQAARPPAERSPVESFLRDHLALYAAYRRLREAAGQAQIEAEVNRITPTVPGLEQTYRDLTFLKPGDYPQEWQAYEHTLRETLALLRDRGIPAALVAFPDLAQMPVDGGLPDIPQQMLARVLASEGTPFLDLLPVYRAQGDITSLYLMYYSDAAPRDPNRADAAVMQYAGDGHPSPYGHRVAAWALADLLIERGLVPPA